jgi:DNA-binding transcriptional MerR regulator
MSNDVLLTGEVARRLEVAPITVRGWEKTGRLVPVGRTSSGVRFYDKAAVEAFAAARAARRRDTAHDADPR